MKSKILFLLIIALGTFLRLFNLENNPPGFYSDEASYAYNAFSILKTGKDEYGRKYPIVFEAFGDYKLPVMLYSIVATFALAGVSDWSARLPGALYGIASIIGIFYFTKTLINQEGTEIQKKYMPHISALLLAIAPAHIFASRGTWELMPALCFTIFAANLLIATLQHDNPKERLNKMQILKLTGAIILSALALYAYNSARVFIPLLIISLLAIYYKKTMAILTQNKMTSTILISISLLLILPILLTITQPQVLQRAKYISIFYDKGVEARLYDALQKETNTPLILTRILHNKIVYYGADIARRYASHFDLNFLFMTGDTFEIFRIIGVGFLPIISLPLLLAGWYTIITQYKKWMSTMILWMILSPLPSALTIFTPSASRAMNLIVPLVIIASLGAIQLYEIITNRMGEITKALTPAIAIALVIINTAYIANRYFIVTPQIVAEKWNDGYEDLVKFVKKNQDMYDNIIVSSAKAPSYIFFAWYLKYDPALYQKQAKTNHAPDEHGLNFTSQFGKYTFTKEMQKVQEQKLLQGKNMYIGVSGELKMYNAAVVSQNGKHLFEILK